MLSVFHCEYCECSALLPVNASFNAVLPTCGCYVESLLSVLLSVWWLCGIHPHSLCIKQFSAKGKAKNSGHQQCLSEEGKQFIGRWHHGLKWVQLRACCSVLCSWITDLSHGLQCPYSASSAAVFVTLAGVISSSLLFIPLFILSLSGSSKCDDVLSEDLVFCHCCQGENSSKSECLIRTFNQMTVCGNCSYSKSTSNLISKSVFWTCPKGYAPGFGWCLALFKRSYFKLYWTKWMLYNVCYVSFLELIVLTVFCVTLKETLFSAAGTSCCQR